MSDSCLHCGAQLHGNQVQATRCVRCGHFWRRAPAPPPKKTAVSSRPPPPNKTAVAPKRKKKVTLERLLRDRDVPFGADSYPLKKVLVALAAEFEIELPPKATKVDIWQILDGFKFEE